MKKSAPQYLKLIKWCQSKIGRERFQNDGDRRRAKRREAAAPRRSAHRVLSAPSHGPRRPGRAADCTQKAPREPPRRSVTPLTAAARLTVDGLPWGQITPGLGRQLQGGTPMFRVIMALIPAVGRFDGGETVIVYGERVRREWM